MPSKIWWFLSAPMKIELAPPFPPPKKYPTPQNEEFYEHGGFLSCRKNQKSQVPIKLPQPYAALELQAEHFTDMRLRLFLFWKPQSPVLLFLGPFRKRQGKPQKHQGLMAQRRRDDNKNIIFAFEGGGGPWGQRGKSSKNAVFFVGNATTIKF